MCFQVIAIFAFATTTSHSTSSEFTITCGKDNIKTQSFSYGYAYRLVLCMRDSLRSTQTMFKITRSRKDSTLSLRYNYLQELFVELPWICSIFKMLKSFQLYKFWSFSVIKSE